jgi:hypothetical protein
VVALEPICIPSFHLTQERKSIDRYREWIVVLTGEVSSPKNLGQGQVPEDEP